jgi:hypothetical protein
MIGHRVLYVLAQVYPRSILLRIQIGRGCPLSTFAHVRLTVPLGLLRQAPGKVGQYILTFFHWAKKPYGKHVVTLSEAFPEDFMEEK